MTAPRIITGKINAGGFYLWQAWTEDLDASPVGYGPTEQDAIDDFLWMWNAMEAVK